MDPRKGFESIRKSQQQERQSTSHCQSLLSSLGICQEKFLKQIQYELITMSSSIQRKYTTPSLCRLYNLLGKTSKTEA